jgi:hypothetical protein
LHQKTIKQQNKLTTKNINAAEPIEEAMKSKVRNPAFYNYPATF